MKDLDSSGSRTKAEDRSLLFEVAEVFVDSDLRHAEVCSDLVKGRRERMLTSIVPYETEDLQLFAGQEHRNPLGMKGSWPEARALR